VALSDGRVIGVPLAWFPRLLRACREQREAYRISGHGLHWEALDEDVSISGLLAEFGDQTRPPVEPCGVAGDACLTPPHRSAAAPALVEGLTTISTCCPNAVKARISRSSDMPRSL
jgi:hypothetical protein